VNFLRRRPGDDARKAARASDPSPIAGAPNASLARNAIRDESTVEAIDRLLAWSRAEQTRIGFFAALYWQVAVAEGKALADGKFKDPVLFEQVTRVFFGRYLAAVDAFRNGPPEAPPAASWLVSFVAARDADLIVVQHLLLGANAHINFDLSVAIAECVTPAQMPAFRQDFEYLNEVFRGVIHTTVANVSRVSRVLSWVGSVTGRGEDILIGFSLRRAREGAWKAAGELSALTPAERTAAIAERDAAVAGVAGIIKDPGWFGRTMVAAIHHFEKRDVSQIISDLLEKGGPS
jgi:hypothetical protein